MLIIKYKLVNYISNLFSRIYKLNKKTPNNRTQRKIKL